MLVTFCGAMIKFLVKSNSRKKGLFWPIVPGFSLLWQGSHSGRNLKLMATFVSIVNGEESSECLYSFHVLLFICTVQISNVGMVPPPQDGGFSPLLT